MVTAAAVVTTVSPDRGDKVSEVIPALICFFTTATCSGILSRLTTGFVLAFRKDREVPIRRLPSPLLPAIESCPSIRTAPGTCFKLAFVGGLLTVRGGKLVTGSDRVLASSGLKNDGAVLCDVVV